jgi:hypothetical protein
MNDFCISRLPSGELAAGSVVQHVNQRTNQRPMSNDEHVLAFVGAREHTERPSGNIAKALASRGTLMPGANAFQVPGSSQFFERTAFPDPSRPFSEKRSRSNGRVSAFEHERGGLLSAGEIGNEYCLKVESRNSRVNLARLLAAALRERRVTVPGQPVIPIGLTFAVPNEIVVRHFMSGGWFR